MSQAFRRAIVNEPDGLIGERYSRPGVGATILFRCGRDWRGMVVFPHGSLRVLSFRCWFASHSACAYKIRGRAHIVPLLTCYLIETRSKHASYSTCVSGSVGRPRVFAVGVPIAVVRARSWVARFVWIAWTASNMCPATIVAALC